MRRQILDLAPTNHTVLIQGETGTGKELVARSLYLHSRRAGGPFVPLNCGAVTESLIESELFGHERGAFTGAVALHAGVFEAAHGGTVFLDEVGELPPPIQPKLLRFLDDRAIRRVGGTRLVAADVRIIAATNRELRREVEEGRFREDLFHRLNRLSIRLPPLRERREDIAPIAERYLAGLRTEHDRPHVSLSVDSLRTLEAYDWAGNIRELQNIVLKAFVEPTSGTIEPAHLGRLLNAPPAPSEGMTADDIPLHQALQDFEAHMIRMAITRHPTLSAAARALGIDLRTLYAKRSRHGLG